MSLLFTACQDDESTDLYQLSQTAWEGDFLAAFMGPDQSLYYKVNDISVTFLDRSNGEFFMKNYADEVVTFQYDIDDKMVHIESNKDAPLTGNWWISDITSNTIRLKRSTTASDQMDVIELSRKHF